MYYSCFCFAIANEVHSHHHYPFRCWRRINKFLELTTAINHKGKKKNKNTAIVRTMSISLEIYIRLYMNICETRNVQVSPIPHCIRPQKKIKSENRMKEKQINFDLANFVAPQPMGFFPSWRKKNNKIRAYFFFLKNQDKTDFIGFFVC